MIKSGQTARRPALYSFKDSRSVQIGMGSTGGSYGKTGPKESWEIARKQYCVKNFSCRPDKGPAKSYLRKNRFISAHSSRMPSVDQRKGGRQGSRNVRQLVTLYPLSEQREANAGAPPPFLLFIL